MSEYEKVKAKRVVEIEGFFSPSPEETWQRIEPALVAERRVCEGPVGGGWLLPLPYELVETFTKRFSEECEGVLTQALFHPHPKVVAYALIGLGMIGSGKLEDLPGSILARTEQIEVTYGCFVMGKTLGAYALEKQMDALEMKGNGSQQHAGGDT